MSFLFSIMTLSACGGLDGTTSVDDGAFGEAGLETLEQALEERSEPIIEEQELTFEDVQSDGRIVSYVSFTDGLADYAEITVVTGSSVQTASVMREGDSYDDIEVMSNFLATVDAQARARYLQVVSPYRGEPAADALGAMLQSLSAPDSGQAPPFPWPWEWYFETMCRVKGHQMGAANVDAYCHCRHITHKSIPYCRCRFPMRGAAKPHEKCKNVAVGE